MLVSRHGCFPACSESRVESGARLPDSRCGQRWFTLRHSARLDCIFPRTHVFAIDRFPPENRSLMAISCRRVSSEVIAIPLQLVLEEWVLAEDRRVVERS